MRGGANRCCLVAGHRYTRFLSDLMLMCLRSLSSKQTEYRTGNSAFNNLRATANSCQNLFILKGRRARSLILDMGHSQRLAGGVEDQR
jgi:hypothetical protein